MRCLYAYFYAYYYAYFPLFACGLHRRFIFRCGFSTVLLDAYPEDWLYIKAILSSIVLAVSDSGSAW